MNFLQLAIGIVFAITFSSESQTHSGMNYFTITKTNTIIDAVVLVIFRLME